MKEQRLPATCLPSNMDGDRRRHVPECICDVCQLRHEEVMMDRRETWSSGEEEEDGEEDNGGSEWAPDEGGGAADGLECCRPTILCCF